MNAQLRGHFRGRFTAAEPQLHSVLLEYSIELLSGLLGLSHRLNHSVYLFYVFFNLCPPNRRSPNTLGRVS
jgi:hypothetical protein